MPTVTVGRRAIPYDVRTSARAKRKRIEVTPGRVEVIVPEGESDEDVARFVASKRRWLHDKTEEIREAVERLRADTPEGYHSGAKILFRGRYLKLRVEGADVTEPSLTYRTGFHVRVPAGMDAGERERAARALVEAWTEERLVEDAWAVVRARGRPHGLEPAGVRIRDQKTLWGSCGKDGVIRLDRKLARVPRPVFEYVVVHELCHLRVRDHSPAFWELVRRVMPDYEGRKAWLEGHEVRVG
ncbi:MAG: SprT family zinc-dependent metalloprotease [Gemmatimonadota bacterium]|nr:SprT family zinc-dependent metalloprotease [Gemmatimonadota bacterium]